MPVVTWQLPHGRHETHIVLKQYVLVAMRINSQRHEDMACVTHELSWQQHEVQCSEATCWLRPQEQNKA